MGTISIRFVTDEWMRLSHDMRSMLRRLAENDSIHVPDHRKRQTADALVRRGYATVSGETGRTYKITETGQQVVEAEDKAQGRANRFMGAVRQKHVESKHDG